MDIFTLIDIVTKYHKLTGLNNKNLLFHSSESQRSKMKVSAVLIPSRVCEGRISPRPLSLLGRWPSSLWLFTSSFLYVCFCIQISFFKKYIYWLCYYSCPFSHPPYSTPTCPPPPSHIPPYTLCPWVILISSLASTFPTLFLPSPCLFSTYHLCYLFSVPFPPSPPPTSHLLAISLFLILICLVIFCFLVCFVD